MCKPCWRAKTSSNERTPPNRFSHPSPRHGHAPRESNQMGAWTQRGTGDVNEYRSPMPDPHFAGNASRSGWSMQGSFPRRGPFGDGNYRAPSSQNDRRTGAPRPNRERFAVDRSQENPARARDRVSTDITCSACGTAATVPFKPAEGQKVFCRACFQSEKPT
jgi:CxxC-x17-CxxC domain-containing protein